jgi:CheY-like chemotaxis protein
MLDKILCIEDDSITLMLYKMVIKKTSFSNSTDTARSGQEALDYFKKFKEFNSDGEPKNNQPQLIFLDLNMPIMDGWEFLDNFSTLEYSDFNHIKVIILSSTINPSDIEKSKKYSMVIDFLSKPISKEMLEYVKARI